MADREIAGQREDGEAEGDPGEQGDTGGLSLIVSGRMARRDDIGMDEHPGEDDRRQQRRRGKAERGGAREEAGVHATTLGEAGGGGNALPPVVAEWFASRGWAPRSSAGRRTTE